MDRRALEDDPDWGVHADASSPRQKITCRSCAKGGNGARKRRLEEDKPARSALADTVRLRHGPSRGARPRARIVCLARTLDRNARCSRRPRIRARAAMRAQRPTGEHQIAVLYVTKFEQNMFTLCGKLSRSSWRKLPEPRPEYTYDDFPARVPRDTVRRSGPHTHTALRGGVLLESHDLG